MKPDYPLLASFAILTLTASIAALLLLKRHPAPIDDARDRLWAELTLYVHWLSIAALLLCALLFGLALLRVAASVHGWKPPFDVVSAAFRFTEHPRLLLALVLLGVAVIVLKNVAPWRRQKRSSPAVS